MALKKLTDHTGKVYGHAVYGRDRSGARFYMTVRGSLREARQIEAETCRQIGKGTFIRPAIKRITFGELGGAFLEAKKDRVRPVTLRGYESHLHAHILPFFRAYELGKADFRELTRLFVTSLKGKSWHGKPLSYEQINKVVGTLHSVLEFSVSEGYLEGNPVRPEHRLREAVLPLNHPQRRPAVKIRVIPLDAVKTVVERAERGKQRAAILLGLAFALRPGEIRALQWGEIDWLAFAVNATRTASDEQAKGVQYYDPKTTASAAKVYLKDRLEAVLGVNVMAELKAWRLQSPHSQDRDLVIFKGWKSKHHISTGQGDPYGNDAFTEELIQPVFRRAGVEVRRPYDLRHTSISMVIHLHYTPVEIRDHARHTSYEFTVSRYGHIMMEVRPEPQEAEGRASFLKISEN